MRVGEGTFATASVRPGRGWGGTSRLGDDRLGVHLHVTAAYRLHPTCAAPAPKGLCCEAVIER